VLVYVATTNAGKLRELRAIFAPHGWQLVTFDGYREPEEGETSYLENAALKARALAATNEIEQFNATFVSLRELQA
jgi:XTP/dITP diphosphohydrolase